MRIQNKEVKKRWSQSLKGRVYYKERNRRRNRERRLWFQKLKSTFSCISCGESDSVCLDFHHRESETKRTILANNHGYSMRILHSRKAILDEIAKCDVLCANCHRKLHNRTSMLLTQSV